MHLTLSVRDGEFCGRVQFEDVVYKIKTKAKGSINAKQSERAILKGISGAVLPGEMLAMLGPSGSGKTTLLTTLGGRIRRVGNNLDGSITYNGRPFSNSLKRNMGFVTQDDVLYPHLTVTETLVYTALLRLPSTLSRQTKVEQADAVIAQLGLAACRNSIIGGPLVRGISGGERKRVSIGQEVLINPSLLLLDEPTSGLDSTIAGRIVSTLWDLTKGGKTVVMTIHQPSSRLFYMFHKVLLLSDGNPIYYGKASDAMDYFARIGYAPTVAMNPADFLLDLANVTVMLAGISTDDAREDRASTKEALVSAYRNHLHGQVSEELSGISKQLKEYEPDKMATEWCTTWCEQFKVLLQRDLKERKHESFSGLKIAQVLLVALLAGFLWLHSGGHVQDQVGLLFFVVGFWSFYPVFQAIFTFPLERTMLTKERSSGMYRLSSYFAARMVADLPMELILPIIFVTITYWMGSLKPVAASFFTNLAVLLLSVLVAQGLGLALGALVMDLKAATTLASVLMLSFMLAGGYFVQNIPPFIAWIKYISLSYYAFKLQISSQYSPSDTYQCTPVMRCQVADFPSIKLVGFDHQGMALAALFLMLFLYRLVAYLGLMRVGVTG
ncbi:ABC transporter G family member 9 [Canna indica]|uniref:ABC transporter G family member 9 n=1 Tax=Canna indica TaxID=4628 RepID=A0AAQ3L074_9LILI|nr:ABC transporter G family member 9 [Canna indica]